MPSSKTMTDEPTTTAARPTMTAQIPAPGFDPPPTFPGPTHPDQAPTPTGDSSGQGSNGGGQGRTPTELIPKSGKAFGKIAEAALRAVGGLLNRMVAVDDDDLSFIPDEDDEDLIPPPLGRLAARRVPLGKNADDLTELEDIGMLLVGLIAYGLKGLTDWAEARRERGPKGRRTAPGNEQAPVFAGEPTGDE